MNTLERVRILQLSYLADGRGSVIVTLSNGRTTITPLLQGASVGETWDVLWESPVKIVSAIHVPQEVSQ